MTDNEMKIEFAPGCFDDFEGTQEELDQLVKDIQDMVADGSLFADSNTLTEEDLDDLPQDLLESIVRDLEMLDSTVSAEDRKKKLN